MHISKYTSKVCESTCQKCPSEILENKCYLFTCVLYQCLYLKERSDIWPWGRPVDSHWHQASIAAFQSRLCLGFVEGVGEILHHGYGHKHFCFSGLTYCSLNQVKIAEEHETLSNHLHSTMFVEWIKDGPDYGFYATVYCCEQLSNRQLKGKLGLKVIFQTMLTISYSQIFSYKCDLIT